MCVDFALKSNRLSGTERFVLVRPTGELVGLKHGLCARVECSKFLSVNLGVVGQRGVCVCV